MVRIFMISNELQFEYDTYDIQEGVEGYSSESAWPS